MRLTRNSSDIATAEEYLDKNYDLVYEEFVADSCESFLRDGNLAEKLSELESKNKTLAEKIKDFIKGFIEKLDAAINVLKGKTPDSYAGQLTINRLTNELTELHELWSNALVGAAENNQKAIANINEQKNNTDDGVKNSIRESFYKQIDNWDKKTIGFSFVVGDTSDKLQKAGLPKKQIRWDATKIVDTLNKHNGMDIDIIKKVPEILENPIVVVDSKTVEGRKVVLGEVYDKNKKLVVVALELNPSSKSGKTQFTDIIKIASSQGRSHIQSLLDSKIIYVDENKKKSSKLAES